MKFDLDSHKCHFHPDKVIAWREWQNPFYPLSVELSPTSGCNQNCLFCAFDFQKQAVTMNKDDLLMVCEKIAHAGNWSNRTCAVTFSGEGEPMLSPSLSAATNYLFKRDIRVGLMTNGTIGSVQNEVSRCAWIRFSINAFTPEEYERIHGKDTLEKVCDHLRETITRRNILHAPCSIGIQCMFLDQDEQEVLDLAEWCKDSGADYFVVKPVSCHPQSENQEHSPTIVRRDFISRLEGMTTDDFQATFRHNAFAKEEKPYVHCLAAPWFHLITSDCKVWPCAQWVGVDEYCLGNFKYQTWAEIIMSTQHGKIMEHLRSTFDVTTCRHPCRLDAVNRYLWRLGAKNPHDYFV